MHGVMVHAHKCRHALTITSMDGSWYRITHTYMRAQAVSGHGGEVGLPEFCLLVHISYMYILYTVVASSNL